MSLAEEAREHEHERGSLTQSDEHGHAHEPAASEDDDGLPLHRIALRSMVRGAAAGLCVALTAILVFALGSEGPTLTEPLAWLLMWVGAGTGSTMVVFADEVSRHAPPRLRLPAATLIGALTTAIMAAAVVWLGSIFEGKGLDGGWAALASFFGEVLRNPKETVPGAGGLLIVFLALWRSRTIRPGAVGLLLRSLVGGLAGLLSFLLLCACWGFPGNFGFPALVFTLVPAAAVPGLSLGGLVEERLLAWLARWRAAGEDG